ncbi:MAG: sugar porter family MFS transporter [Deltaproteobacteria bacterium]|nr:sugar porter family MFS transporter [Deltaproteobacteria bacterium]
MVASAAALGGFLFGFDTAIINGTVTALRKYFSADSVQIGLAVSLALVGSAIGAFFAGRLADRIGRLKVMMWASVAFSLSAIGSGAPFGLVDFILWRALGGVAVGAASVIAPAYIAEVSPAHKRGRLATLQQLAIVVGIFVALLLNYVIAQSAGSAENPWLFGLEAWRWMFWSELPVAVLYGVVAFMIPESPRFLVARGRDEEAKQVLERVGSTDDVAEIKRTVAQQTKPSLSDLKGKALGLLPIVWVGIGLAALQQLVGINVIFYYSSVLWRAVGFSESDALAITVITGATNIVTTFVAIAYVDKFGRKPLLLIGSIGMALMLGALAIIFETAPVGADGAPDLAGTIGIVACIMANVYVFCFGFSWGPVMWVMLGEMFNNRIRGSALAVAGAVQWGANFLVSTTFPPMLDFAGLGFSYGMYTFWALISIVFVMKYVHETKGMTLEQMK